MADWREWRVAVGVGINESAGAMVQAAVKDRVGSCCCCCPITAYCIVALLPQPLPIPVLQTLAALLHAHATPPIATL